MSGTMRLKVPSLLMLVLIGAGCAQPAQRAQNAPLTMSTSAWTFDGRPARIIKTDHYTIHTTMSDPDFIESLVQVMEGALQQYRALTPGVELTGKPMNCYIFSLRHQWATFTEKNTGSDASVYLQINRGGYTVNDWFVSYYIGDTGTFAVASHEGWHQYVARHFKMRLPPFMEEGIATMFENIAWPARRPRWNLSFNPSRADRLRTAIQDRTLWPLQQLCTMHAGDVVALSGDKIETFYAQNWAFAQFMYNAEGSKYRPAFQRMLMELASGEAAPHAGRRNAGEGWDPRTVRPLLEYYLGMDIEQIDKAYQAYIRQLVQGTRQMKESV
jgi:hypothetical protein